MATVRGLSASALFLTSLAVVTAACGTSGGGTHSPAASLSPTAVSDPLAGWSAQRIAKQSEANTRAARYVRVSGTASDSGHKLAFDLTLVAGVGCRGTVTEQGLGSFVLISKGKTVWIQPDAQFYRNAAGQSKDKQLAIQLLTGKYLEDQAGGAGLGSLASVCSLSGLVGNASQSSANDPVARAGTAMIDGQRALKLFDAKVDGYAYVSDTAKPEILRLVVPGASGGSLNFTYYTTAPAITAPPASEVVDGSKYGF